MSCGCDFLRASSFPALAEKVDRLQCAFERGARIAIRGIRPCIHSGDECYQTLPSKFSTCGITRLTPLRLLLDAEGVLWEQRLHWDYRPSARLLMQYLDNHMLPGYAAVEDGQVTGYVFCVYEDTKAVIGDVFALPGAPEDVGSGSGQASAIQETLLKFLFELLLNSPHVDRIESQLLLHPSGSFDAAFRAAGFEVFRRLFLVQTPSMVCGARPSQMTCPAILSCALGARLTLRRRHGSSAKPIAVIPTV